MATLKNTTINDTGFFTVPTGTTAQRPASPVEGMIRYNTTNKNYEGYQDGAWVNITVSTASIVSTNRVLYYDFGNIVCYPGSGTTIYDLSGNGNNGTMGSGTSYSANNSGIVTLSGSGSGITTSYKIPGSARSHSYWVYFTTLSHASGYQLSGTQESGAYTYIGIQNGGAMYYYMGSSTGGSIATSLVSNTWYNLCQTMSSSGAVTLYVNGTSVYTTSASVGNTATANFYVGNINGNHNITGNMGMILLYTAELTAAQVLQNYNAVKSRYGY